MVTGIEIVLITSCLTITLMTVTLILESYGALIIYYVIMLAFAQNIPSLLLHYFCYFLGGELDLLFVLHLFYICTKLKTLAPSCDRFVCNQKNEKKSIMQTAIGESLESCEMNRTSRSRLMKESIYLYSHSVCFNSTCTVLLSLLLHIHFTSFKVQAVISISLHCSFRFHYFTGHLSSYRKHNNSISGKQSIIYFFVDMFI